MAITENRKNNRIWGRWIVRKWRKKKRERKETLHTASGTCYFALYWPKPCTPETQERLADPQIQRLDPQCTKSRSSRMLTLDDWLVIANIGELCFLVTFSSNSIFYLAWSYKRKAKVKDYQSSPKHIFHFHCTRFITLMKCRQKLEKMDKCRLCLKANAKRSINRWHYHGMHVIQDTTSSLVLKLIHLLLLVRLNMI